MATQPELMNEAFAGSLGAAKTFPIPQSTTVLGKASLNNGFPTETSMPLDDGGVPPQRADFNGMLYWLSTFALYQQSGGLFTYNSALNYDPPSIVYYNGDLWWCKLANGPSSVVKTPNDSNSQYWIKLRDYLSNPLSAYPVGAYYISSKYESENDHPSNLFGGTWEQVKDRMIIAAGNSYTMSNPTGGSATKTLTVANLPSHNHTFITGASGAHTHTANGTTQTAGAHTHGVTGTAAENGAHSHTVSGDTSYVDAHTHSVASGSKTANAGSHDHDASCSTTGKHSHGKGTMKIVGTFSGVGQHYRDPASTFENTLTGAFYRVNSTNNPSEGVKVSNSSDAQHDDYFGFDSSLPNAWTGSTSETGNHSHTITIDSNGSHSHSITSTTLTLSNANRHSHSVSLTTSTSAKHTHSVSGTAASNGSHVHTVSITISQASNHTHTGTTNSTGSGTAFNIMPPYTVAYVWRRIA